MRWLKRIPTKEDSPMKLYYAPGTCSLASHIVIREAGLDADLERVDIARTPYLTETGADYRSLNPHGYVPLLQLDSGELMSEGVAILLLLADLAPDAQLAPHHDAPERHRLLSWLTFISSELHKSFSPWLFHPEVGEAAMAVARRRIRERLAWMDGEIAGRDYLLGDGFTVADAYAFAIIRWSKGSGIVLAPFANLTAYMRRIAARPAVREALVAEGLLSSAAA
jgi:glutathione S-transferase